MGDGNINTWGAWEDMRKDPTEAGLMDRRAPVDGYAVRSDG